MAALVFSGVQPRWIRPRYDANLHLAHPPSPEQVEQAWQEYPDAAGEASGADETGAAGYVGTGAELPSCVNCLVSA